MPVPIAARPIKVFEFAQLKVAPPGLLTKLPIFTGVPGHAIIFATELRAGIGFIVNVTVA